ncbi:MAG: amidohydrolase [Bacteroidia bacterium]
MEDLRITYIQPDLHWEKPAENLNMLGNKIRETPATDLIILPEMFSTGFSMKPELYAQEMSGTTVQWMREQAGKKNCVVTGSVIIQEKGCFYNRLIWMTPEGNYACYDKRHLFRHGGEQEHYEAGTERINIAFKGWSVRPLICYDLRFPVWSRNRYKNKDTEPEAEYDLLIYTANWPEVRSYAWKTLLLARAIENQAYVVGINRIGIDGKGMQHAGDSAVINFKGELLSKANSNLDTQETILLSASALKEFRTSFPAGMDADQFTINA